MRCLWITSENFWMTFCKNKLPLPNGSGNYLFHIFFVEVDDKGNGDQECTQITKGLGRLHTQTVKSQGQQQHRRQEEITLTAACQEGGLSLETQALIQLVHIGAECQEGENGAV